MRMKSDEIGRWILDRENSEMATGTRGKSILAEKTCAEEQDNIMESLRMQSFHPPLKPYVTWKKYLTSLIDLWQKLVF